MAFWYFVIYSFLGWVLELAFARATGQEKQDRKCFYLLPLCPVYGFGALAVLSLAPWAEKHVLLMVIAGGAAATAVEYLVGLWDERVLGVRFWDYEGLAGSVGGKICLPFAAMWGILAAVLVYFVHPAVAEGIHFLPQWMLPPAAVLVAGDGVYSALLLKRTGTTDSLKWSL